VERYPKPRFWVDDTHVAPVAGVRCLEGRNCDATQCTVQMVPLDAEERMREKEGALVWNDKVERQPPTPIYQRFVKIQRLILVGPPDKPVIGDAATLALMDSINFGELGVLISATSAHRSSCTFKFSCTCSTALEAHSNQQQCHITLGGAQSIYTRGVFCSTATCSGSLHDADAPRSGYYSSKII
jgi:hypothetical protein